MTSFWLKFCSVAGKPVGMIVVFVWLMAHVLAAQSLVDSVKTHRADFGVYAELTQYFFFSLQFLAGGIAWDVLKKIKTAEIDWGNLLVTIGWIGWFFLCMLAFLFAALATAPASTMLAVVFILAFIASDVLLTKKYFSFMEQIKKGVGKL